MRVQPERIGAFDGKLCFICGSYLLNNKPSDLAYAPVHTGRQVKAQPERYYLFQCPNCNKIAHKRCWYDVGEKKHKDGWFGPTRWQLECPSCGETLSPMRDERTKWKDGYQIPGHSDDKLIELRVTDVFAWKAGSVFGKIGKALDSFFRAVGLGSLTENETSAVARAANRIGKTTKDIASKVFRLEIPAEKRSEIKSLSCQNCGAPLPLPEAWEEAVVCEHCGTAHLLPV
ncbi:hypothetical protein EU537_04485 [Candidatus Thorarchaeota archaeon]|nr:MAG: hypothetical protein EU537_04485 [Candidatus Thorarchaeota archaeon]